MAKSEQKDLIIAYRNRGLSYSDIAARLGVTAECARTVFSRANRASRKNDQTRPNGFCKNCGKQLDMVGNHRKRLFCDDKCRSEFHNQKVLHTPYICVCENCGHEFVSYGNPAKRFCSRECQILAGRKE